ncbi:MAG: alpha/beta hydrolase [Bacteroides sp.]|nr:alpha/beta hydrolase [Bacteroides sp.]
MFTEINGLNINYICEGDNEKKQSVLLLHGWGADIKLFAQITACLSPYFKVYAPDLPGFGESDEPREPWPVDGYADFVVSFCEKMGIEDCYIIAHSFGGRIAIKLMSRDDLPFRVEKLVLTGSAGIRPKQTLKKKIKTRCYKLGKGILSTNICKRIMPNALENLRKKNGSADYNAASPIMRQCLVKTVNEDLTPLISNIKAPTLLIWGADDDSTPLSDGRLMEKLIPDAGLVVFENSGHFAFLEQGARFCRVISSFFNIL